MATHMWKNAIRGGCRQVSRKAHKRPYSSSNTDQDDINHIPLSKPLPGFTYPTYSSKKSNKHHDTEVTTLSNGLRVASQKSFGLFSTLGVVINSGSRYEVAYPSGISHFLEKLAFGRTVSYGSRDKILQELEKANGICDAQGTRDTFLYAMSVQTRNLSKAVGILADVVCRMDLTDKSVEDARMAIGFELESIDINPQKDAILMEMIHAAAYRDNTLGLPRCCPAENIPKIDRKILYTYLQHFHTPERMVLAGVGMDHDELVELAEEHFVQKSPIWNKSTVVTDPGKTIDNSLAQYTGGLVKVEADLSNVSLGPNPMPELAHIVIGLESCSYHDPDFIPFCILNMLLGGGSSFSAGGPGKGMYSRLYLNVLNKYHWINSAVAYNMAYEDSGMFFIHGSSDPDQLHNLATVIQRELVNTAGQIEQMELNRAKTQLQSMLMMNLESRPIAFEDIGRQVLSKGHRKPPEHYFDSIGRVTAEEITRVAERMLRTKPAVAAYGSLQRLPDYDSIQTGLLQKPAKRKMFSFLNVH